MYQQHRHEALRLSRQWQKLVRRAGAAYAAEDHSGQLPVMCWTASLPPVSSHVLLAWSVGWHFTCAATRLCQHCSLWEALELQCGM